MRDEEKSQKQLIHEIEELRKELQEIKSRESAEKTLLESVEMFKALFNQASDSIFLLEFVEERGPIIVDANIAACKMHGYERDELIGKPIRLLDSPNTAQHVEDRSKKLLEGEKLVFEGEHVRKDGSVFPVEVSAQMINAGGKKCILAIDRDITERKNAEHEREKLISELQNALLEIKTLKVMIPACAWNRKDQKAAVGRHYNFISKQGKCPECMKALKN